MTESTAIASSENISLVGAPTTGRVPKKYGTMTSYEMSLRESFVTRLAHNPDLDVRVVGFEVKTYVGATAVKDGIYIGHLGVNDRLSTGKFSDTTWWRMDDPVTEEDAARLSELFTEGLRLVEGFITNTSDHDELVAL